GSLRVPRFEQGPTQPCVDLVIPGADGHCRSEVAHRHLRTFLFPVLTKQVVKPEVFRMTLLGLAQKRQRFLPVAIPEQDATQPGGGRGRVVPPPPRPPHPPPPPLSPGPPSCPDPPLLPATPAARDRRRPGPARPAAWPGQRPMPSSANREGTPATSRGSPSFQPAPPPPPAPGSEDRYCSSSERPPHTTRLLWHEFSWGQSTGAVGFLPPCRPCSRPSAPASAALEGWPEPNCSAGSGHHPAPPAHPASGLAFPKPTPAPARPPRPAPPAPPAV